MSRTNVKLPDVERERSELTIQEICGGSPSERGRPARELGRYYVFVHAVLKVDYRSLRRVGKLNVDTRHDRVPLGGNQLRVRHRNVIPR